jgi:hypothetical protein
MTPTEIRLSLRKAGYAPLPLFGKAPSMMKNWQERLNTNEDDIAMWAKQGPDAINTGVLTKITPAFDVDVMHPEAARAIEELVRDRFEERGYILTRIGKPPKRAIMFRTDQPFGKILACATASRLLLMEYTPTPSALTAGTAEAPTRSRATTCPTSPPRRRDNLLMTRPRCWLTNSDLLSPARPTGRLSMRPELTTANVPIGTR